MTAVSLRVAGLLALVFLTFGAVLAMAMENDTLRARAGETGTLLLLVALVLLAAWGALLPLANRLGERAARAQVLAERLAAQESALARAERARRELLTHLSHDLRTPLASMQGYLELLLVRHGSLEPAEAQNYLQTAARHSERLSRLVADLFELARLETEGLQPQAEPFPVAELACDVALRFAGAAERAGVTLAAPEPASVLVQAEVALVERVLGNLVDNALRHTPAGGRVAIEIREEAGSACVAVCDTGEGIEAGDLEGLFDRWQNSARVGDTGSATSGLGLAIARRIAQLHGSTLELDSRPGAGTRVSFRLPLAARPR